MTLLQPIGRYWSSFVEMVAAGLAILFSSYKARRDVFLVEHEPDVFAIHTLERSIRRDLGTLALPQGRLAASPPNPVGEALKGSRAVMLLNQRRFMFRRMELPRRASDFLGGIVRTQIDRLTPWLPEDAVFGWSEPVAAEDSDTIALTVAASSNTMVAPLATAMQGLGAAVVVARVVDPGAGNRAEEITVFEKDSGKLDVGLLRRVVSGALAMAGAALGAAFLYSAVASSSLDAKYDSVAQRISERRAALQSAGKKDTDPSQMARQLLARRKLETPVAVVVLDTLSRILPDHTYVTEFRIEGSQLRLVGVTKDAPSLIAILEQSPLFSAATFFAPTTRQPSDPGERFNIEAQIKPTAEASP